MRQFGVVLPLVIALAACGSDLAPSAEGDNTVSGKVLEGSISDAMLPLDTVQSQSPPLEIAPSDTTASDAEVSESPEAAGTTEESEPTPEQEDAAPDE